MKTQAIIVKLDDGKGGWYEVNRTFKSIEEVKKQFNAEAPTVKMFHRMTTIEEYEIHEGRP